MTGQAANLDLQDGGPIAFDTEVKVPSASGIQGAALTAKATLTASGGPGAEPVVQPIAGEDSF